jgi:hypothetical protein
MKPVIIHLPHTPPVLCTIIGEENSDGFITIDSPLMLMEDAPYIYTAQYMPFASNNIVMIQKKNIISMADADEQITKSYFNSLKKLKNKKPKYEDVAEEQSNEIKNFKSKFLN